MKFLSVVFALLCAVGLATIHAHQPDYETLKAEAEKYYADASYSKAREVYVKARALTLGRSESRWIEFRLADTLWRAQAATNTADSTKYDEARRQLEVLVRDIQRAEDRDRVWAEVYESLGDFWWMRNDSKNWQQGWQSYQQALDWWSGSADIETARDRYLKIVWKISKGRSNEVRRRIQGRRSGAQPRRANSGFDRQAAKVDGSLRRPHSHHFQIRHRRPAPAKH
ncbi:MAG: hypothetical protein AABN33_00365 [Acidobacteriota bacterium]